MSIDTSNKFLVGVQGNGSFMIINQHAIAKPFTKDDALLLAAWLVTLADTKNEFEQVLKAVHKGE